MSLASIDNLRVLISDTFDPWFNLATEDWIFRDMDPNCRVLFLWRNSESVVIGRFQNPWVECNTPTMEKDGIKLARRQSGGGAVFHDLGNTNFTFMSGKEFYNKEVNNKIIINSLKKVGVVAHASGRNDIIIEKDTGDPRKVSGSAFKQTRDRCFHHGTLLINADLNKLGHYLNPDKKKLEGKGIKSVKSRVMNLSEINDKIDHDTLSGLIIKEFFLEYGMECEIEKLDHSALKKNEVLNSYYQKLKSWDWCYGETPKFTHHLVERFEWGAMDVHINSNKGIIDKACIYSDSLHPEMIEGLSKSLIEKKYSPFGIDQAVDEAIKKFPMFDVYLIEFRDWLKEQVH